MLQAGEYKTDESDVFWPLVFQGRQEFGDRSKEAGDSKNLGTPLPKCRFTPELAFILTCFNSA